jgi:hypothetical protein
MLLQLFYFIIRYCCYLRTQLYGGCTYIGEDLVGAGFGTACTIRYPLGVVGCIPVNSGGY